jgi:hypothetical protein
MARTGHAKIGTGLAVVAGLLAIQILAVAAVFVTERPPPQPADDDQSPRLTPGRLWQPNRARPTVRPPTIEASQAAAWLGEPVIGVEASGKARAYRVKAFDDASGHLVNDLIGDVPVSVAHCNLDGIARVYAGPLGRDVLDIEVAGLLNRQMVIKFGGVFYYNASGMPVETDGNARPIPYRRLEPALTTWGKWVRQHPHSDLFVGHPRTFPQSTTRPPDGLTDQALRVRVRQVGHQEPPTPPRPQP